MVGFVVGGSFGLGVAVATVRDNDRLVDAADGFHGGGVDAIGCKFGEADTRLGQVGGEGHTGVACRGEAIFLDAMLFEHRRCQRGGDVLERAAALVEVVAVDEDTAVDTLLGGILFEVSPLFDGDQPLAVADDVVALHDGQQVEVVVLIRVCCRLVEVERFVFAIFHLGIAAAARALLVLFKPSGKVRNDFATFFASKLIFHC